MYELVDILQWGRLISANITLTLSLINKYSIYLFYSFLNLSHKKSYNSPTIVFDILELILSEHAELILIYFLLKFCYDLNLKISKY